MARFSAESVETDQEAAELDAYIEAVASHTITGFDCAFKNFKLAHSGESYEVMFTVPLHEGERLLELVAQQQRILHLLVAKKKRGVSFVGT